MIIFDRNLTQDTEDVCLFTIFLLKIIEGKR